MPLNLLDVGVEGRALPSTSARGDARAPNARGTPTFPAPHEAPRRARRMVEAAGIEPSATPSSTPDVSQSNHEGSDDGPRSTPERLTARLTEEVAGEADLEELLQAWPNLPEPLRVGILAMVRAARTGGARP